MKKLVAILLGLAVAAVAALPTVALAGESVGH